MSLGRKILATVLVVIFLGVISQVIVGQKIKQANTSMEKEQWWSKRALSGLELKAAAEHQNSSLAEAILFNQSTYMEHFNKQNADTSARLEEFISNSKRQENKEQLNQIMEHQNHFGTIAKGEIIPALKNGDQQLAKQLYEEKVAPLSEQIEQGIGQFVADREKEVAEQQQIVSIQGKEAARYGLIVTILAAVLGIGISIVMSRSIIAPLQQLSKRAEALAEGDLTQSINQSQRKDEIGDLARSFQKMEQELRRIIRLISTDSMTLAAHSQEMSAASEEVSANVHGIAGLTAELAATAENQAANASGAAAVSKEAETVAREGGHSVQQVITKMESINNTVNNSSQVMGKLSEQSKRIGQIIEAITGIADQTNLLALNAAIEAARAGEHGKGFAVVADEVRTLAEKSATAAKEISVIVNAIRGDIDQAVTAMDMGAREVNEGVQVVEKAGHSLQEIVDKVVNSSHYISEISVASEQTSDATQELAQSTDQVNAAVEQIAQSSISLAKMATDFNELVRHFKLDATEQQEFWEGKEHCSDIKDCLAEGRNPEQCNVSKHPEYPCWNIKGTHCKGVKGTDIRQCKECEVYKRYGNDRPLVVYQDELLESNSGIDWDK